VSEDLRIGTREPIIRYLRSLHDQQLDPAAWRSLAMLLADSFEVWEEFGGRLDPRVVEGIYALCSPCEACVFLGDLTIAEHIETQQFFALCEALCDRTQDVWALRQLSCGLCFHHDRNAGTLIPPQLASCLLDSVDEYGRLCGLKVLRRMIPPEHEFVPNCMKALADRSAVVRCGATHELFCYYRGRTATELPQPVAQALIAAVAAARDRDPHSNVRENAKGLVDQLEHVFYGKG
jgi:hypothetical protein